MSGGGRRRFSSLTGPWCEVYFYPHAAWDPTPFNVLFEDAAGLIIGEGDKPNMFAPTASPVLYARWSGERQALAVNLLKTMDGIGGAPHCITYEGVARADFMRIDGSWTIPGDWSGTFFMERLEAGAAIAEALSAKAGA
jgi:hypothetical protein